MSVSVRDPRKSCVRKTSPLAMTRARFTTGVVRKGSVWRRGIIGYEDDSRGRASEVGCRRFDSSLRLPTPDKRLPRAMWHRHSCLCKSSIQSLPDLPDYLRHLVLRQL